MTLVEFEKGHPDAAWKLRLFAGDWHTGRNVPKWRWRWGDANEVTGVYSAYEEGAEVWYAIVQNPHGEDMAVFKDDKWAYTNDYWVY